MGTSLDGEADAMKMEFGMACTYVLGVWVWPLSFEKNDCEYMF